MEVYIRTVKSLTFDLPTPDTVVTGAKYSLNNSAPSSLIVSTDSGAPTVKLPYFQNEGDLNVTWSFVIPGSGAFTDVQKHQVVTPYLTIPEVKTIFSKATDDEAISVESSVRHIINSHTGQSFGYSEETISVEGHSDDALRLPKRLLELNGLQTLTAVLDYKSAVIISDGWYLKKGWAAEVSQKTSDNTYWNNDYDYFRNNVDPGEPGYMKPGHGAVIVAPGYGGTPTLWREDYPFAITGKWGYTSVPEPVKEAAKLLVNDYACSEIAYRDRYLNDISAADWSFEFSSRAWDFTGNVRADQLLSDFVIVNWAII